MKLHLETSSQYLFKFDRAFLTLLLLPATLFAQAPPASEMPMGNQQVTNIPYFSQRDGMRSILTLNNNMDEVANVDVTIFNSQSKPLKLAPISLKRHSITDFRLEELTKDAPKQFDEGSIEIRFHGDMLGVTSQVGVLQAEKRIAFDSTEAMVMSSKLNGIVTVPDRDAEAFLALTNVAGTSVSVTLSVGKKDKKITLRSRETVVVKLNQYFEKSASAALVRLQHDGPEGAIIVSGFVLNQKTGYSSRFAMQDPVMSTSNKLAGAHFRFESPDPVELFPRDTEFSAPLALANVGAATVNAKVAVDYTVGNNSTSIPIASLQLAPGELKEIDIAGEMKRLGVPGTVKDAGLEISYDGTPGSLIGHLTSVDQSGDYASEVPIIDPLNVDHIGESSYPWSLENGSNTVLHMKNTTDETVQAIVQLIFPDGSTYNPDRIELQPHQTVAIDIQKLKDTSEADIRGRTFPKEGTSGQIIWAEETRNTMIGRAEHTNVLAGTARSFSCGGCCPPTYAGGNFVPSSATDPVGWVGNPFTQIQIYKNDCHNNRLGPYSQSSNQWSSTNTTVATVVASSGQVSCWAPGTADIRASFVTMVGHDSFCNPVNRTVFVSGPMNVTPVLTGIDPTHGVAGTSVSVTLTGSGLAGATVQAGSGVAVSVNSSSFNQIQATFSIANNAGGGNRLVTATSNNQISNTVNFLVQVPASLAVLSDTGSVQDFNCSSVGLAYNGVRRDILYRVFDSLSQPILTAGMTVAETFEPISNTCQGVPNTPTPTSGLTDSLGQFPAPDRLAICSSSCLPADASGNPTGSCSLSVFQNWTANNFSVRRNQITYSCNSVMVTPQ